jgi:predicted permease
MHRFLAPLFRRRQLESVMDEELRTHLAQFADDLVARGVPRADAERRARIEFGAVDAIKEECREARGLSWFTGVQRDFRYAARLLRKAPGVSATAILTLALCIGANTAIFSVVDAVLLRPLPYSEPERLAELVATVRREGVQNTMTSHTGHVWEIVRDQTSSVDVAASGLAKGVNLAARGVVEYVQQQRVSANFFRVLGVSPQIGREFEPSEDKPGGPAVAVLSHRLWKRSFGGDPAIAGRGITLKGEPHTVVGILPPGFTSNASADVWTPLRPSKTGEGGGSNYGIIARLRPGVNWSQAEAEIRTIGAGEAGALQSSAGSGAELALVSLQEGLTQHLRMPLLVLWGAVGLVLLIGCVNIASLLLAKSGERKREIATRMALGGGSGAILRQLLAEALLLALAGGILGTALGYAGLRLLRVTLADSLGLWQTITLDERVLAATFAISLLTSILFGVLPAFEATRVDIRTSLVEGDGRTVAGRRGHWPRRLLVAGEIALSMLLLTGAALLLRTFANLAGLNPGFDTHNLMTATISLDDARYSTTESVAHLYEESTARMREIPGVESAAVSLRLPFERALNMGFRVVDGAAAGPNFNNANVTYITNGYFETLRVPVLRGRVFDGRDGFDGHKVVVVNDAFVKRYLPNQDPVGTHIQMSNAKREIIGVSGTVQQKAGWGGFAPLAPVPQIYVPATQIEGRAYRLFHTWFPVAWTVRTKSAGASVTAEIAARAAICRSPVAVCGISVDGIGSGRLGISAEISSGNRWRARAAGRDYGGAWCVWPRFADCDGTDA